MNKLWHVYRKGRTPWNSSSELFVKAPDEATALQVALGGEREADPLGWACKEVDLDGEPEVITSTWHGDSG